MHKRNVASMLPQSLKFGIAFIVAEAVDCDHLATFSNSEVTMKQIRCCVIYKFWWVKRLTDDLDQQCN